MSSCCSSRSSRSSCSCCCSCAPLLCSSRQCDKPKWECDDGPRHFLNTRGARVATVCMTLHRHLHIYRCCVQVLMRVTLDVSAQGRFQTIRTIRLALLLMFLRLRGCTLSSPLPASRWHSRCHLRLLRCRRLSTRFCSCALGSAASTLRGHAACLLFCMMLVTLFDKPNE